MNEISKNNKKTSQRVGKFKEKYPHFRRYKQKEGGITKKARHPKLIMAKNNDNFEFIGLTESAKRGHHKNIALSKNPERNNTNPSYLRDELRELPTSRFSEPLKNYKITAKDEKVAWSVYHKNKKK